MRPRGRDRAARAAEAPPAHGARHAQDLPQPRHQLGFRATAKTRPAAYGFEHRLLHDVRRVKLRPEPRLDLKPRQDPSPASKTFERDGCDGIKTGIRWLGPSCSCELETSTAETRASDNTNRPTARPAGHQHQQAGDICPPEDRLVRSRPIVMLDRRLCLADRPSESVKIRTAASTAPATSTRIFFHCRRTRAKTSDNRVRNDRQAAHGEPGHEVDKSPPRCRRLQFISKKGNQRRRAGHAHGDHHRQREEEPRAPERRRVANHRTITGMQTLTNGATIAPWISRSL